MVEYDFGFKNMNSCYAVFLVNLQLTLMGLEAVGLREGCYDSLGPAKMETRCYSASGS